MYRALRFQYSDRFPVEFDEEDNAVGPGARQLAQSIVAAINEQGIQSTDPDQHSYYGWSFATEFKGLAFFNVVHPIRGEAHLTVDLDLMWLKALLSKRPRVVFSEYCEAISASIASVSGISGGEWGEYFN